MPTPVKIPGRCLKNSVLSGVSTMISGRNSASAGTVERHFVTV